MVEGGIIPRKPIPQPVILKEVQPKVDSVPELLTFLPPVSTTITIPMEEDKPISVKDEDV
jgi:hypothetical protein